MAVQYIDHAVATGTGTTITWTIPTHNTGDLIILGFRANTTNTTSTINAVPSGYTMIFDRREATGAYPNWVFAKNATGSDSASLTHSVSGGWSAIAIVLRGHDPSGGITYPMFTQEGGTHFDTESVIAGGPETIDDATQMYLVLSMNRTAVSVTATFTSSPSETWTEVLDTYASNLHTAFAYSFPGASTNTPTVTLNTTDANATKTSQWRFVISEAPVTSISGTLDASMAEMTSSNTASVEMSGTLAASMAEMTSAASASVETSGALSGTMAEMTADLAGALELTGTVDGSMAEMTAELTASAEITSTLASDLPEMTAQFEGGELVPPTGTLDASMAEMTSSLAGAVELSGTLDASMAEMTSDATGAVETSGTLDSSMAEMTSSLAGALELTGTLDASMAEMTSDFSGDLAIPPVPAERSPSIGEEFRVSLIEGEDRNPKISNEDRVILVESEDRYVKIKAEDRTIY